MDARGNVYVSDSDNNRVQNLGSGYGQLDQPQGVAVDASGYVYVVDGGNHRIMRFDP